MKFLVNIISAQEKLYGGEAEELKVPGEEGSMVILARHAPLLASLRRGSITVKNGSDKKEFDIDAGFIEVSKKEEASERKHSLFVNVLVRQS